MHTIHKRLAVLIVLLVVFVMANPLFAANGEIDHLFPRTANYYLRWEITNDQTVELAKWDVLILDMETQVTSKAQLAEIKRLNPDIILLAYITPQEIRDDAATSKSQLRKKLADSIHSDWYVKNTSGQKQTWWPGTYVLNVSDRSPIRGGQRLYEAVADFVAKNILSTGIWDGIFYDNAWDGITWFTQRDIDLDLNGKADSNIDTAWKLGMEKLYENTRQKTNHRYIIVGNGTTREYTNHLNGKMIENFIPSAWAPSMQTYAYNHGTQYEPKLNIINVNTNNGGTSKEDYKAVRFGLGSTLLEDGYFSFDYGDKDHGQLWWYDEYNVNLGNALTEATSKSGHESYTPDVWQRQFENGVAVVNSSNKSQTISLNGEYEKIHGVQDPAVNDGSIVSEIQVHPIDGIILLKTFAALNDVVFTNGHFLRFFRPDASRVRNGFFAFDETYKGNDQIALIDVNGDEHRDTIQLTGNVLNVWKDDGQRYMRVYPYTADYTGSMTLAVGDIDGDTDLELVISPNEGSAQPIKIYDHTGTQIGDDWFPFGAGYKGGYSVAIARLDSSITGVGSIIVGAGKGKEPRVSVYDAERELLRSFLAYEPGFRGGVHVAAGDLDADRDDEIITGPGKGGKTWIKVFSQKGIHLGVNFQAYDTLGFPGIRVGAADVDFDGKDDILTSSEGISF